MINEALVFLKKRLNTHLSLNRDPGQSHEDLVTFIDGDQMDPPAFKLGTVTMLLVNIEEDNVLRSSNRYGQISADGKRREVQPEIRLNLLVLFAARYKQYEDALRYLSQIIQYFQNNRVFDHQSAPELSDDIDKLILELITLPFSEQNEIWGSLRVPYHPSVLYRTRMIVYRTEPQPDLPKVETKSVQVSQ